MTFLSVKQIVRRSVLARNAIYRRAGVYGAGRSNSTRVLHLVLLVVVLHQLISSKLINRPLPGDAPSTLYSLHEYLGIGTLAIILIFWLWTLIRHGETKLTRLFPWLSPRGIGAVIVDTVDQGRALLRGDFSSEGSGALASAVHGLGLLVVTAMAVTGTAFFLTEGTRLSHYPMRLHALTANLMWIYLIGHSAVAVLHHLLGSDVTRRMFWINCGITIPAPRSVTDRARHEELGA